MLGRMTIDGAVVSTTQVDSLSRDDLALGRTSATVESPTHAVTGLVKLQSLPMELPPHIHEKAKVIGQIKSDMKDIEIRSANAKELAAIRDKLLLGHKDAANGLVHNPVVSQAIAAASSVPAIALRVNGNRHAASEWPGMQKPANTKNEKQEKAPNIVGIADQQVVIGRIDDALLAVDKLLGKIDSDQSASNLRLLNLTGSMAGLNAARSTVDSTPLSISVAMNAAEMIMTNVKAAVVSHGNISTDIVRLVMT
jgi:hypothetical protein